MPYNWRKQVISSVHLDEGESDMTSPRTTRSCPPHGCLDPFTQGTPGGKYPLSPQCRGVPHRHPAVPLGPSILQHAEKNKLHMSPLNLQPHVLVSVAE